MRCRQLFLADNGPLRHPALCLEKEKAVFMHNDKPGQVHYNV